MQVHQGPRRNFFDALLQNSLIIHQQKRMNYKSWDSVKQDWDVYENNLVIQPYIDVAIYIESFTTDTKRPFLSLPEPKCFKSICMFHANPKHYCNQSKNIYFLKPTTQSFPYFLIRNPNRQQIHQKKRERVCKNYGKNTVISLNVFMKV